eukprot:19740_1
MKASMTLLFFIIAFINIIEGYQCRLYLYTNVDFTGGTYGPYDVGQWSAGAFPNDAMISMKLYAEGYWCHARLYVHECGNELIVDRTAAPFGSAEDRHFGQWDNALSCVDVWSDATPKPTPPPSETPTMDPSNAPTAPPSTAPSAAPTTAPTSSCLDYNNETSFDGNNEIREFNYKNIININNYHINKNIILEFNTSH